MWHFCVYKTVLERKIDAVFDMRSPHDIFQLKHLYIPPYDGLCCYVMPDTNETGVCTIVSLLPHTERETIV